VICKSSQVGIVKHWVMIFHVEAKKTTSQVQNVPLPGINGLVIPINGLIGLFTTGAHLVGTDSVTITSSL